MSPTARAAVASAPARGLRRSPAPRVPRRVSGPAPAPKRGADAAPRRRRQARPALLPRIRARVGALTDAPLLDRLLAGRAWIVLVGFLLIGIVAMQVSLLELNAGIGRAVDTSSRLQRENAELRASVSRMSAGDRVEAAAARLGMVMPDAGTVRFVAVRPREDARRAVSNLRAPELATPTDQAAVTGVPGAPAAVATPGTPTAGAPGTAGTAAPGTVAPAGGTTAPATATAPAGAGGAAAPTAAVPPGQG